VVKDQIDGTGTVRLRKEAGDIFLKMNTLGQKSQQYYQPRQDGHQDGPAGRKVIIEMQENPGHDALLLVRTMLRVKYRSKPAIKAAMLAKIQLPMAYCTK